MRKTGFSGLSLYQENDNMIWRRHMKKFFASKKGKIIAGVALLIIVIGVALAIILSNSKNKGGKDTFYKDDNTVEIPIAGGMQDFQAVDPDEEGHANGGETNDGSPKYNNEDVSKLPVIGDDEDKSPAEKPSDTEKPDDSGKEEKPDDSGKEEKPDDSGKEEKPDDGDAGGVNNGGFIY